MSNLLLEGGSFGAIEFIYRNYNLTFKQFREILGKVIDGSISKMNAYLKTDGQNLMLSRRNGQFIFSRTKKHSRDFGEDALESSDQLVEYLHKIPEDVQESFRQGADDMVSALSKIDELVLEQIFDNGRRWLSYEIINPATKNVIDYGGKYLFLHTIITVNEAGTHIDDDRKLVQTLWDQIESAGTEHQKSFVLRPMVKVVFNDNPNTETEIKELDEYLKKFYAEYELKETDRIKKYVETWWRRYITKNSDTEFADDEMEVLIDRFVSGKVDFRLTDFEKYYGNSMVVWIKSVDKIAKSLNYLLFDPLRFIHDEIGHRSLTRLKTHISTDPERTAAVFRKDFNEKIKWIQSLDQDDPNHSRFDENFRRLAQHTDVSKLKINEEGFTFFSENGILYKITGYFSFINQLFGIGKYSN